MRKRLNLIETLIDDFFNEETSPNLEKAEITSFLKTLNPTFFTEKLILKLIPKYPLFGISLPKENYTEDIAIALIPYSKHFPGLAAYFPVSVKKYKFYLNAVKHNSQNLQHVPENLMSEQIILAAIKDYGDALRWVPEYRQSEEVCLASAKSGGSLEFVHDKNEEISAVFILKDPYSIKYLKNPSNRLCMLALQEDPQALMHIENQTVSMCLYAVKKSTRVFQWVRVCPNKDHHSTLENLEEMKRVIENKELLLRKIKEL